jgi:hypothetical protein
MRPRSMLPRDPERGRRILPSSLDRLSLLDHRLRFSR